MNKLIRTEEEYKAKLRDFEGLLDSNPQPHTSADEELELLSLLIRDYESKKYAFTAPDPVEAIKFRMEQQNLTQKDLIPYLGSRSRVSEILSKKRPLSISMIRALNKGLGIPADVLIQESQDIESNRLLIDQIIKWGWIPKAKLNDLKPDQLLHSMFENINLLLPQTSYFRSSYHVWSQNAMDEYALKAWLARVLSLASAQQLLNKYEPGTINLKSMIEMSKLSESEDGPLHAIGFLNQLGIKVVIERHLPQTYLDGAAIMLDKTAPVIGLTIRYDRLDNFWFTLMHELAHIALHFDKYTVYYDDLEFQSEADLQEQEANELALEAFTPKDIWDNSLAKKQCTPLAVKHLAHKMHISPAIVVGRSQHELNCYEKLRDYLGCNQIRKLFPSVNWGA